LWRPEDDDRLAVNSSLRELERGGPGRLSAPQKLVVLLLPWILGFEYGNGRLRLGLLGLGLVGGVTGAVRALRSVRSDPVRSAATIALSIVPIVILGWILFVLLGLALGGGFELG
jgi:hypothetical protein